jgi:hypothetical protein
MGPLPRRIVSNRSCVKEGRVDGRCLLTWKLLSLVRDWAEDAVFEPEEAG